MVESTAYLEVLCKIRAESRCRRRISSVQDGYVIRGEVNPRDSEPKNVDQLKDRWVELCNDWILDGKQRDGWICRINDVPRKKQVPWQMGEEFENGRRRKGEEDADDTDNDDQRPKGFRTR
jgi:hypothetical protein